MKAQQVAVLMSGKRWVRLAGREEVKSQPQAPESALAVSPLVVITGAALPAGLAP